MENKLYLKDLPCYGKAGGPQKKRAGKNPYYDLESLPSQAMRDEMAAFLVERGNRISLSKIYWEHQLYKKICRFLQKKAKGAGSFLDRPEETWVRQFKGWMLAEHVPLAYESRGVYGEVGMVEAKIISYLKKILRFVNRASDNRAEQEKDIWELEKLDIRIKANPIKNCKTLDFTRIPQQGIRAELKKGIYLNLQGEAIACVQKEMTAMRRLTGYLAKKKHPTGAETIIRIRQMKTKTYEKPVSGDLAGLIRRAMAYTREQYGETKYLFVDRSHSEKPLQYNTIQNKVVAMIHKEDLRDDNGRLFGFGTHMYRHYYGMKLTEMHLDDFTIAKLLGHRSVRNVKYYRRMGNQPLADETRETRQMLSELILQNLDGWEAEYEQIRQDADCKQESKR